MKSNNPSTLKTIYLVNLENSEQLKGLDNKFHYFYKIVNNVNSKYYYGVHSTYNLDDGYCGSGSILKFAYKKYGYDNFTKYVLQFFDDRKSLLKREKYIVNEELLNESDCYNMALGGNSNTETLKGRTYLSHTTKGMIHINNSLKNKMVKTSELNKYISEGWVIGQLQKQQMEKLLLKKKVVTTNLFIQKN